MCKKQLHYLVPGKFRFKIADYRREKKPPPSNLERAMRNF